MGKAGVKVRVRCISPWPLRVIVYPLLGVPVPRVGLAICSVSSWVRVSSGGGCPRP